jgi:hypothetical protein
MKLLCPAISQIPGKRKVPTQKTKDFRMVMIFLLISYSNLHSLQKNSNLIIVYKIFDRCMEVFSHLMLLIFAKKPLPKNSLIPNIKKNEALLFFQSNWSSNYLSFKLYR